jgi:dTDP-4-amino-4,6-dideoxygalactose transaminase
MGDAVRQFERSFANWLGVDHAFAFWRGRVALYAILRALGIGPGDEVVVTGYTCIAVVRPIKYVGATPKYVDIEPRTYCMAPELLEEQITPRTRLIIAQHTYGYSADMDRICAIAASHCIPVIEDACLAVGSRFRGELLGKRSLAAYWSGQWSKHFTTGLGGWVTTGSDDLCAKLTRVCEKESLRPTFRENSALGVQRLAHDLLAFPSTMQAGQRVYHWFSGKGVLPDHNLKAKDVPIAPNRFFRRMGPGQARAGFRNLRRLKTNIQHRLRIAKEYERLLADRGWPVTFPPEGQNPALVRYPVRVADKEQTLREASRRNLEIGAWFDCPLHQIRTDLCVYDYPSGSCPVAERISQQVVNLPLHPRIHEDFARRCVDLVVRIGPAPELVNDMNRIRPS